MRSLISAFEYFIISRGSLTFAAIVLQGYNSSLTMLDSRSSSNNSNLVSENKSSLPNENMSQDNSDLDDEIPF